MAKSDVIKVAVDAGRGIAVHARGNPAQVVAVGAAAGIVMVSVAVGYGGYVGGKKAVEWIKKSYS